jgi:hypothetical protein
MQILTVIVSTKMNWWATNHHMGQPKLTHFVAKSISTLFTQINKDTIQQDIIQSVHRIGHWASTHVVLNIMGIYIGKSVVRYLTAVIGKWNEKQLTSDFILRIFSGPSGTAPSYLIHATLSRFYKNKVLLTCPYLGYLLDAAKDLKKAADRAIKAKTLDPCGSYHMGAEYLSGKPRLGTLSNLRTLNLRMPFLRTNYLRMP